MTTQVSTKIRLVRCPKCRQILPELPGVSLYKCGVCGTILQAKNRKLETSSTGSSSKQGENEASSSNHDFTSPPKSEPSLDKDSIRCQDSSMEVKESLHEGDNSVDTVKNSPDHESVSLPKGMIEDNGVPPENDDKGPICFTDQNGEFHEGIKHGILSHENDNVSQSREQSREVDDATDGVDDSIVSFYLSSPEEEHLDHFPTRNFGRISSLDTLGSSPLADVGFELNYKHESTTNYQTTRGSYYANDGSESSYDGTYDRNFERISHFSRKNKDVEYVSPREKLRKDGFRRNNTMMDSEPEMNYWATNSSHRPIKSSPWSRGKSSEINRDTNANMMRQNKLSPSKYRHNLLPPRPGFNSSEKSSYTEPDKAELLRTVCELKDQLNRMHFPNVSSTNRMLPSGVDREFATFHHDHSAPQSNISRMAFSGDATHYYRHRVSCSCLHCSPQNCHYSAQLPLNYTHCTNRHCGVHTDHSCCTSPQHYTSSEFSLRNSNEIKRLHVTEKRQTAKRHLRPLVGGAPLIACYHCSEILQLPADFLLFKKRCHKLMCSACKKILKFSLQEGTHIVQYLPEASAPPPPSVAEGYNDATSRCSSCGNVEPVSFSDDYGRSLCKSCSTKGENSVVLPSFDEDKRKSYDRKSSYEPVEDRKMKSALREPSVESVGPSSKWRKATSEIEPCSSNSPLHRLMGYSSPSHVLNK